MYHVFGLLAAGILYRDFAYRWIRWAGNAFLAGVVLFSGSLYALTLLKATETAGLSGIGIITPIGGLCFIAGWLFLFLGIVKKQD